MALATSGPAPTDLASPFLQSDGTPLGYDDYAMLPPSAVNNMLDNGAFGTLAGEVGLDSAHNSQFLVYYPE